MSQPKTKQALRHLTAAGADKLTSSWSRHAVMALGCAVLLTSFVPHLASGQNHDALANTPAEPVRIAGPIYFVGTEGLASWLIATSAGHILIDTGMPGSGPMIAASIRKLGFDPEDIKVLTAGHARADPAGGIAYLKKLSGGRVAMMAQEVDVLESGGALDFFYGRSQEFAFLPVQVDQVLHDGDDITVGGVTVRVLLTAGLTQGSTTFVMTVADGGITYTVAFPDGITVNPGYRLVHNPSYPGIADNYRRSFQRLESLKPDIWLTSHTHTFGFAEKRERAETDFVAAWVDPDGYHRFVADARQRFDSMVSKETK